jgi:hypothetical protein
MQRKSGKNLLRLGYKVRSVGASRFCIVVVDIHEEFAAACEKRRENKRKEQNGEERKRNEHKRRTKKRTEEKARE